MSKCVLLGYISRDASPIIGPFLFFRWWEKYLGKRSLINYLCLYLTLPLPLPIVYNACPLWCVAFVAVVFSLAWLPFATIPVRQQALSWCWDLWGFCNNITATKLRTPSGNNPRYYVIIYFSWRNILIHSPEVYKISKPELSDFFCDTNYTELFVEFLSFNTLFKSDTTNPANHTIVSRC